MPGLVSFSRRLLHPIASARQRWLVRRNGGVLRESGDQARRKEEIWQDADRLERIAVYARAGYFNLSYTYEMFHLMGEMPPE
ncbi:MAG TPA: hypothetical protein VGL08_04650 [Paraburkholderia sp.]|jgi:hypothetical protein